jgi:predicted ArsR family transcriptional regulator
VENNPGSGRFGPRAGSGHRPLSDSRLRVLNRLRDQPEPVTLSALVAALGLHENTVREHLDALVRRGLVRRFKAEPSGRGRPAWLYESTGDPATSEYATLAAVLADTISRTSRDPGAAALAAGEGWGRDLAQARSAEHAATVDAATARDEVIELLDDLGFSPQRDTTNASVVHLTRCPLLEAAHRHPEVVCSVHLGIVRGALAAQGASPEGSDLTPFAEPGACRLVLPPLPRRRRQSPTTPSSKENTP